MQTTVYIQTHGFVEALLKYEMTLIAQTILRIFKQTFTTVQIPRNTRQQPVSAQILPTSGPHGFHMAQIWAGSEPKLCCCLGWIFCLHTEWLWQHMNSLKACQVKSPLFI